MTGRAYSFAPARLGAAREAARISRARLALELGLAYDAIYRWESGRAAPSGHQIASLATILGIHPADLFEPVDTEPIPDDDMAGWLAASRPWETV